MRGPVDVAVGEDNSDRRSYTSSILSGCNGQCRRRRWSCTFADVTFPPVEAEVVCLRGCGEQAYPLLSVAGSMAIPAQFAAEQ